MADELSGVFRKPFKEQVAFFRQKLGKRVPTKRWDDLRKSQHDTAFMVAGAAKADLLAGVGAALDKAVSQGTGLNEFRKDFKKAVATTGWHGWTGEGTPVGEAWRTRVIFQTNMQTSYSAGRYAQLKDSQFDVWVYHHNDSVAQPRAQHEAWDGLTLPPDDPFWDAHYPPNGWGCQCYVTGAHSQKAAEQQGGKPSKQRPADYNKPDAKTGEPDGIAKGWGYAPGKSVAHLTLSLSKKLPRLPAVLGASFWATSLPESLQQDHQQAFARYVDQVLDKEQIKTAANQFVVGAIAPDTLAALKKHNPQLMPVTAEIVTRKGDIRHLAREGKTDKLDLESVKQLPDRLRHADAVLLDTTQKQPALLYVIKGQDQSKLIVKLDYTVKKDRVANVLRSARALNKKNLASVKGQLGQGGYRLLKGDL